MWRPSLNLLRFRLSGLQKCRRSSSLLTEKIREKFQLATEILPSEEFLERLTGEKQEKVARIIAELEAIYAVIDNVPSRITDPQWNFMLTKTVSMYDREEYLRHLYSGEVNSKRVQEENERRKELLEENTERFERGEIVYGSGFHQLYMLYGKDFRRIIDSAYGSKMWIREKLDDNFQQFYVDCRFIHKVSQTILLRTLCDFQRLHDMNWMSKNPLPITFANYLVDSRIAEAARSLLHFQYGPPPAKNKADSEDIEQVPEEAQKDAKPFVPAPFAPRFAVRPISSILPLNVKKDEVAYITQAGDKYLDDETLHRTKIFVVHAFPEVNFPPMCRDTLLKSLEAENIETYRLPLDANVKCINNNKCLPASKMTSILRDMLTKNHEWKDVILKHCPNNFIPLDEDVKHTNTDRMTIYVRKSWNFGSTHTELLEIPEAKKHPKPVRAVSRTRVHAYSREERNRKKAEQSA